MAPKNGSSARAINAKGETVIKPAVPETNPRSLMKSILSNKPLACDDIHTLRDARAEIQRIRKLMDSYKQNQSPVQAAVAHKEKRVAIHQEEHINDYVKKVVPKDAGIRQLLHEAIRSNVLFESNTDDELKEIIDVFEPCTYGAGDVVIQQDDRGDEFYVVEKGELSIKVRMEQEESIKVGNYHDGSSFGELALIYGSPRAATITATEPCLLWRMKRGWYRGVVGQHRQRLHKEKVEFLPNVKVAKKKFGDIFTRDQIDSMAQLLQQQYFKEGHTILREGEAGNTFYIIRSGEVNIFKKQLGNKAVATLGKEKFFGEKALLSDDVRQATVVAASPVVACYVMTRGDFTRVLGNLQDIIDGTVKGQSRITKTSKTRPKFTYKLDDLEKLNVLGQGAFGKVNLVKAKDTGECYALKAQGKQFVLDSGQEEYIVNEFELMKKLHHPNVLLMHCAMQDTRYVYFLLDLLPGGELMDILEANGTFTEEWVRFYSASVLLAYTEFHKQRVVYRDLKPENLVLDRNGYCVVVDLGLAKELTDGPTYTFCGTPDYIAPEIIRGTGYSWAVDYWALGVFLYELHSGRAPFQSYDPTGTAKKILAARISFPSKFSLIMQNVVRSLLNKDPTRRLGCMNDGTEGVMRHRFYAGFDWQGLLDKRIKPPYKPKLPANIEKIGKKDRPMELAQECRSWTPILQ